MLRMNSVQTIYEDKSYRANSQRLQPKKSILKGTDCTIYIEKVKQRRNRIEVVYMF